MSLIPGVLMGLLAGFFPRLLGPSIMRLMDVMLALPSLLLAVAIVAILGPGLINTVIAIAIVSLPSYVRLTRAAVMGELNRDYVTAARLAGASLPRLMFVTVLPNCMAPLIVQATLSFSSAILDAAALGFLGLGVQPPTPEWGTMLASARDYIERAWWVVSLPGLTILLSVLAINLMGDGCATRWTRNSRMPPEETPMSLLQINNLNVRFGDAKAVPVVDGLDLSVEKGEVLAIVGESGSGNP